MGDDESNTSNEKLEKWAKFGIKVDYVETTGTVYDDPKNNNKHLKDYATYLAQLDEAHHDEPDFCIPLNPPIVPKLIFDDSSNDFIPAFEEVKNFILYAAEACQKFRVNEETSRRSKLRWYSALADAYDNYKRLLDETPILRSSKNAIKALEIAEIKKNDKSKKSKKGALAKEVMAGKRINKILEALQGQWHIIDLHDNITKEFLVNNNQQFIDDLVNGINFPNIRRILPYKLIDDSGSLHQYRA